MANIVPVILKSVLGPNILYILNSDIACTIFCHLCKKKLYIFFVLSFHLAVDSQAVEIIGHHSEVHSQQQHSQEQHTTTSGRPQKASSAAKASMAIQWPYQQPPPHPPQPIGLPPPVPQHNDLGYTSIHEPSGNTLNHNQLHHPG